jgi:hypothetical protein
MAINVNIPNNAPKYLRDIVNAIDELKKATWQETTKQTSKDYQDKVGTIKHIKYGTNDYRLRIMTEDGYVETLQGAVANGIGESIITNKAARSLIQAEELARKAQVQAVEDIVGNLSGTISDLELQVFTDANGGINRVPDPTSAGLYIGSTHLGYWTGSQWKTYMNNNGAFFLDGTNGYLAWNPVADTLQIKANMIITNPGDIKISDLDNDANFVKTFYQSSAPTYGMDTGDLWYDTDDKIIYRYSGSAWVNLIGQGVRTFYQTTAPTSGMITGDVWYDTDDKKMYRFNGSTWDVLVNRTYISDTGIYTGTVNAAQVNAGELNGFTMTIGSGSSIYKADTNGIYLGNSTFASAPFRVTPAGALTATNATITGSITLTNTIPNDKVAGLGTLALKSSLLGSDGVTTVITASGIQTGSIKAGDIAASAITADKINAGAVTTAKLDALAVTTEKLAANAVTAEKIAAGTITANEIASGSITTDRLTAGTLTGYTIQTASSGQRVVVDGSNNLRFYDSDGNLHTTMSAAGSYHSEFTIDAGYVMNMSAYIIDIDGSDIRLGNITKINNVTTSFPATQGSANTYLKNDGSGNLSWSSVSGSGTVTSVALSLPSIFSVSGSPVTTSGTLTATLASQTQNKFLGSPNGYTGTPTFRGLEAADIPSLSWTKITSDKPTTLSGYGITDAVSSSATIAVNKGGTGATTASAARTNLGLGGGISTWGYYCSSDGVNLDRFVTVTNGIITNAEIV